MSSKQWFFMQGTEQPQGPFATETILGWIRGGSVQLSAQVSAFGGGAWAPVGAVPEFSEAMRQVGPPPPPVAASKAQETSDPNDAFGILEFLVCVFLALPALFVGLYRVSKGWKSGSPMIVTSLLTMIIVPVLCVATALLQESHRVQAAAAAGERETHATEAAREREIVEAAHPAFDAYVSCKPSGRTMESGFACTIEHKRGPALKVCWRISMKCQNGKRAAPRYCGTVARGGLTAKAAPFGSFAGDILGCDQMAELSITDTEAVPM